ARRSSRLHQPAIRSKLSSGKGRFLSLEERCAGRARSDPSDGSCAYARFACEVSQTRRTETLSPDLATLRGVADDARRFRPDDDRHSGRQIYLSRHWLSAEV